MSETHESSLTDAKYVAQALAGESWACAALVGRYHPGCLRFARHLLGDERDAEDAVQETFIRAFAGLARYDEREKFRSWLMQILVNRCRSAAERRARHRARCVNDERALEQATRAGDEPLLETQRALARALAGLDLEHREAFLLKVGEELSYDELAQMTGASVAALKMRVKRARDHVRLHWPGDDSG